MTLMLLLLLAGELRFALHDEPKTTDPLLMADESAEAVGYLTEGVLIRNNGSVRANIDELARIGVTIAIDDFGTGYSNLQYLRDIPARVLKIDQSFIRFLTENPRDPAIVRSLIDLSHTLGYRVVAEGIEARAAADLLASWGCDEGQGYFIARPAPLAKTLEWVRARGGGGR